MRVLWILAAASVLALGQSQIMSQIGTFETALDDVNGRCVNNNDRWRRQELTDISVECGTSYIDLTILVCPVLYTGYNESLLILNSVFDIEECKGTLDSTVDPPVVRFRFPINMTHACGSTFITTSAAGTGIFADFSNIETVNISGMVHTSDPTVGVVTYNADLFYYFSCAYPLEYLINNTRVDVSSSSISVRDKNGSFISTLSMELFSDEEYTEFLTIPEGGLELRQVIYVQVKADNLTDQYSVLMDRCYASISPLPDNSTFFNLFVPCSKDRSTIMLMNGDGHKARFSFQAFRFIEQQNEEVSTYYLHCITRLCEISTCESFKQCNAPSGNRRKRRELLSNGATEPTLLSTNQPIVTKNQDEEGKKENQVMEAESSSTKGLEIAVGILAVAVAAVFVVALVFYMRMRR